MLHFGYSSRVMEPETISINGASPKCQTSRKKILRKTWLIFFTLCCYIAGAFAQDVITLKNGEDIESLVQEIGDVDIKYKKFDNPNGPNYTMKKAEIFMIRYANGTKDVFLESTQPQSSIIEQQGDFKLKKSAKIILDVYGMAPSTNKVYSV